MKLIKNIASLSFLQIANFILPFIIVPYLTKILGPDNFGKISFAQAIINYFLLLTDFGFNMSATQQVAIERQDQQALNKIFWTTTFAKGLLAGASFIILLVLMACIPQLQADALLYFICFATVVQSIFLPVWLLQGIEKTEWIIPLSVLPKVFALPLIFVFVKHKNDYVAALTIQCLVTLFFTVLFCLLIFYKKRLVQWYKPDFASIKRSLYDGWHIFLSTAAISFYTTSNTVLLGIFTSNSMVGYFVAADKLIKAVQALLFTIGQAAYPRINKLLTESREKAVSFLNLCLSWMGLLGLLASIMLFVLARLIVQIVFGLKDFAPSVDVVRILSFTPFIVSITYVFGILGLLTFGFKKVYSNIYMVAGLFSLSLSVPATIYWGMYGVAVAIVLTELFIVVLMLWQLKKNEIYVKSNLKTLMLYKEQF